LQQLALQAAESEPDLAVQEPTFTPSLWQVQAAVGAWLQLTWYLAFPQDQEQVHIPQPVMAQDSFPHFGPLSTEASGPGPLSGVVGASDPELSCCPVSAMRVSAFDEESSVQPTASSKVRKNRIERISAPPPAERISMV